MIIQQYQLNNKLLNMKQRTKPIQKAAGKMEKGERGKKKVEKEKYNQEGEPEIKNLSDFVIPIKPIYHSRALYTGGRILTSNTRIYSICSEEIVVYDIDSRKIVNIIKHNNQEIVNFAICPFQKHIITFTNNYMLRVLSLETNRIAHSVKIQKYYAFDIAYSTDGAFIAVGCVNSQIKIYSAETMKESHSYRQHQFKVTKVQWHPNPDNLQVISADEEKNLVVFDYILNKAIAKAEDAGRNFVMTEKGTNIVTSKDQQIKVYQTKELKLQYRVQINQYIDSLYLCPNQTLLFGGQETDLLALNMNDSDHTIQKLKNCSDRGVMKILPISHRKEFLVVSLQQNITRVSVQNFENKETIVGYNDQILDLKYSKYEDSRFFLMATNSNNVKIMDRQTHQLKNLIIGHKQMVLATEYFHPYAITAGKDKIIKLWRINESGKTKLIANYRGHSEDITGVGILYHQKLIVSVSEDKTIKVWPICQQSDQKVEIKSSLSTIIAHTKSINVVKVSQKKDHLIATCSHDRTIKIWQWQDTSIKQKLTLTGHKRGVWDAIFHKVENLLVSVAGDGMMKGWNLSNGDCVWSMGESSGLLRCAWVYHNQVVTGSVDGIIKIWDIRKQTSISYDKHGGKIWSLDVHQGEDSSKCQIISGDNSSKFYVWKDNTDEVRESIIHTQQDNQQEQVNYNYFMHQKKYIDAAKIAFQGNLSNAFVQAVYLIFNKFSPNSPITEGEEGKMVCEQDEQDQKGETTKQELTNFVAQLAASDLNKLLSYLQTMNSTVKHFKMANRLLYELMRIRKFKQWEQLDKSFVQPFKSRQENDEIVQKESDFQKYVKNMQLLTEKHYQRLEKYARNSYWFDYLEERQNPFA